MAQVRRRVKPALTFEERLAEEAKWFKEAAEREPLGSLSRHLLLRQARQVKAACRINDWLRSPGLRPPEVTTVALDLADAEQALSLARQMAEQTGRTVTLCDADGKVLGTIRAFVSAKN